MRIKSINGVDLLIFDNGVYTFKGKQSETEKQLLDYLCTLTHIGLIKFTCSGEDIRDGWKHDKFVVSFHFIESVGYGYDKHPVYFDYCAGVGHRVNGKPITPHIASVLHCIVMDGEAVNVCFDDWCNEYGYDSDSRKAFATYEACCENGQKLRKVFTPQQIERIRELLQDY